jgi:anaerobic selenocysteine-containing dehydrogenase
VCRCCTAGCGIVADVRGSRVISVRGDPAHPNSRGYLCPKGHELPWSHARPDRLNHPAVGGRRVSWDAALDDIARRLATVVTEHGPQAYGWYLGNGTPADHLGGSALARLAGSLGSTSFYSAATIDIAPSYRMAELVTGTYQLLPRWRWEDTECRLILWLGGNPTVSHGYQTLMPDPVRRIRAFRERGGRLWVVDPRRTRTASMADEHLQISPGTDHALLAFLIREVGLSGGELLDNTTPADRQRLDRALEPFTADRVASETGLPADRLAALADAVRSAGRLAVVAGTGVTFQKDALLTEWLRWLLLLVTDSLDKPGGMWFIPGWFGALDLAPRRLARQPELPRSPGRPELARVAGQLAAVSIPDDVAGGSLRALVVSGGNPVNSFPDPARTSAALAGLDLLVVLDVVASPTTALATHLLPVTGQLERMDVVQVSSPRVMVAPAVVPAQGERRPVWWIVAQLARRMGIDVLDGLDPDEVSEEQLTRAYFRAGRQDLGDPLGAGPDGIALPVLHGWVRERVLPDGRWAIMLPEMLERLEGKAVPPPAAGGFRFVAGRRLRRNGSLDFVAPEKRRDEPWAYVHPDDARSHGLEAGDLVTVTSANGSLSVRLATDPSMARGVVTINQGWPEANVSHLTSLHADVDPLTGQPAMSALDVSIGRTERS